MGKVIFRSALLLALLALVGCSSDEEASSSPPATPLTLGDTTAESFDVGGSEIYEFTATSVTDYQVHITDVSSGNAPLDVDLEWLGFHVCAAFEENKVCTIYAAAPNAANRFTLYNESSEAITFDLFVDEFNE